MNPKIRTFRDRIRDAIRAFKGKPIGSLTFGVDVRRCDKCEYRNGLDTQILYLCDREQCEVCSYPECRHTPNIANAVGFNYVMDTYFEKEEKD